MKSVIDIEDDVFKLVYKSALSRAVTGTIYKGRKRPSASTKEDITIKLLSVSTEEDEQIAFVNVNIYVADKPQGNSYDEDIVRIRSLMKMAEDILHRGGKGYDFRTTVASEGIYEVEGSVSPEHFINIKVKYQFNS